MAEGVCDRVVEVCDGVAEVIDGVVEVCCVVPWLKGVTRRLRSVAISLR